MGQKERYHTTLDSDLVKAAERLGGSRSEIIEKALRLLVSGHASHSGGHAPATDKKLIEFEKKLNGKFIFIKGNHDRNNSLRTIITKMYLY